MERKGVIIGFSFLLIFLAGALIKKRENATGLVNPCHMGAAEGIKIVYIMSSSKIDVSTGCALCDSDSRNLWKKLYGIYGRRDYIEFIVIFPDTIKNENGLEIPFDIGLAVKKERTSKEDLFIICVRREMIIKQRGRIDMSFIRAANNLLSMAYPERDNY